MDQRLPLATGSRASIMGECGARQDQKQVEVQGGECVKV